MWSKKGILRKFLHNSYDNLGRIYHFDDSIAYHSVTTCLNATADKSFLEEWRNRIGDEEADRQVKKAQDMGEEFHEYGEDHLNKIPISLKTNPFVLHIFKKLKPHLKPIQKVHAVEHVLYSDIAQLAGRVDGIVQWHDWLAIIDFKLVNYWKDEWIEDYWLQCAIYAHMWHFMTGDLPTKLILGMGNKKFGTAKAVIKDYRDYAPEAVNRIQKFRNSL